MPRSRPGGRVALSPIDMVQKPDPNLLKTKYPDGVLGLEYFREGAGHLRLNEIVRYLDASQPGGGHSSAMRWVLALTAHLEIFERDRAIFSKIYGEGLGRYLLGILPVAGARLSTDGTLHVRKELGCAGCLRASLDRRPSVHRDVRSHRREVGEPSPAGLLRRLDLRLRKPDVEPALLLTLGVEYIYGRRESQDDSDLDNHCVGLGFQIF